MPFPIHVLLNPVNQGYGGNQKIGYHFAIEHGFDFVALLHGDGQYAPECLPDLVRPLRDGEADAVFGSRMFDRSRRAARRHAVLQVRRQSHPELVSEPDAGHVAERVPFRAIASTRSRRSAKIPFELNTNDFHFDTEIIIQLLLAGLRILELPIPTYYGDEICHVNGLKYAADVTTAVRARALAADGFLLRSPLRLPVRRRPTPTQYEPKLDYLSPHTAADGNRALKARACSTSAAPAATWAPCSAASGDAA